jgi:hypothetical protein
MHNNLLLLLQTLHHTHRHFQHIRHNIRGSKRQPLRQANVRDTLTLVNLNERQILRRARILNIMATVIRKYGCVTGLEVECTTIRVSCEDGGARGAGVEIEPFFGLVLSIKSALRHQ